VTKEEFKRAFGAMCMLTVFGVSFILRHENEEHDERKAKSRLVFTPEVRRVVRETIMVEPKALV
jgi:hypothetical protein